MQFPEQLPSFEVLLVFSQLYNLRLYVHLGAETPLIFDYREDQDGLTNCIHLQCIAGIHFNPVTELRSYDKDLYTSDLKNNYYQRQEPIVNETNNSNNIESREQPLQINSFQCQPRCKDLFVVTVKMNESDQLHCALIDTGSQISIVRKSVWNELPDDYKRNHILESNCNTVIKGFGTKSNIIDFIGQIDLILIVRLL